MFNDMHDKLIEQSVFVSRHYAVVAVTLCVQFHLAISNMAQRHVAFSERHVALLIFGQ